MSERGEEVSLVSRWKLKAGLDEELVGILRALAGRVEASEPDTLMYRVHLPTEFPLDQHGAPAHHEPIPISEQKEVVFVEVYRNARAFAAHTQGDVFKNFLATTIHYFEPDPNRPGWPVTDTVFMSLMSGFERSEIT
ncbi:MAG: antibiotic biosynthesis monooxygenase [Pseudomonadota bacterium]